MKKDYFVLTKDQMVFLGIYDELLSLYTDVIQIYEDVIIKQDKAHQGRKLQWYEYDQYAAKRVRERINRSLWKVTFAFTDKFPKIKLNGTIVRRFFTMFKVKEIRPRLLIPRYTWKFFSFAQFIEQLTLCVNAYIFWKEYASDREPGDQFKDYKEKFLEIEKQIEDHVIRLIEDQKRNTLNISVNKDIQRHSVFRLRAFYNLKSISCNRNNHEVISERFGVPFDKPEKLVFLPVHRCLNCGRVFIGIETISVYENHYGKLLLPILNDIDEKPFKSNSITWGQFGESELHKTGYNVQQGKMTDSERHELLEKLIRTKSMSTFQICRDIENAISIFENRPGYCDAVRKWKDDLLFVNELVSD